ncbi:hypothetical protein U1Q18_008283 [Sarracenia purpurea var. burkii]
MATAVHQPATISAAAYSTTFPQSILSTHPSKPPTLPPPSILSISLSKTLLCLSKPKPPLIPFSASPPPHFLPNPALSISKPPPLQPLFPQNPDKNAPPSTYKWPQTGDYFNLLRLSVRDDDVEIAAAAHASVLKLEEDTQLSNALIVAYLKLGLIDYAHRVFLGLSCPDLVSYTKMISGFAKSNREDEAVELFFEMRGSGIEPNEFTFVAILTACIRVSDLELGSQIHSLVIKMGYSEFTFVSNALIGLYSRCGCLDFVLALFDKMLQRDIVSWNTIISGKVKALLYDRALEVFRDMKRVDGFTVDHFTLSTLLVACTKGLSWMGGREIHAHALRVGFQSNLSVNNALIGFYTECGSVREVSTLFNMMPRKDVITWTEMVTAYMEFGLIDSAVEIFDKMPERNCVSYNALLAGYCRNGNGSRALALFCRMVEEGIELTDFTLTSVINACGLLMDLKTSKQVHGFVLKFGFGSNDCIESALLDMCTRCGRMVDAEEMFYQFPQNQNNPIMWTSMICGYSRNGQPGDAISLFFMNQSDFIAVDEVSLAAVLGACGTLGFHIVGKQIHCLALKIGLLSDIGVGNAVLSMYCKCGNMDDAIEVFNKMSRHDIVSWNSLMTGHLLHRQGDEALDLWSKMEMTGLKPDAVTFLLNISAYRHTNSNLVDNCWRLFLSMKSKYDIEPTSDHYAAFIGVLGNWDLIEEAEEFINKMPFEPDTIVWRALLDASRIRSNTKLGKWAAKQILGKEPKDPSTYILVSNLYSASGRWVCSESVREEMGKKGFLKLPIRSWTIHQNTVHSFYARDKSHGQSKDIYSGLNILILECLKVGGENPDTCYIDINDAAYVAGILLKRLLNNHDFNLASF